MTEKIGRGSLTGNVLRGMTGSAGKERDKDKEQPGLIPMSLFAAWDADRTPPNCVPRLCSLTLSRLTVLKPLGPDITSITLAVKMQNSKRTLRSNEIALPPAVTTGSGQQQLLDTELDLSFALQYPHYLKQWDSGNRLQVMLQRRKRYKNRTILGFKTICSGTINMAAAMQRTMDLDLELYSEGTSKEKEGKEYGGSSGGGGAGPGVSGSSSTKTGEKVSGGGSSGVTLLARVTVQSLSSQPVDNEEASDRLKAFSGFGDGTAGHVHPNMLYSYLSSTRRHVVTAANPSSSLPSSVVLGGGVGVGGVGGGGAGSGGVGVGGRASGFIRYVDDVDEDDFSSNEENSDSDRGGLTVGGVAGVTTAAGGGRQGRLITGASASTKARGKIPPNARQRNLKQKFIALLKRFKITEDLDEHELAGEGGCIDPSKLTGADLEMDAGDIEDLIDELEDLSDSGPEMDTLSVTSTPKPSLRPFFASSRSLLAPDPSSSASVFTFPSVYSSNIVRPGPGLLERHYSDESSKRGGGGAGDSGDSHPESLWGTDQERESDTPTASSVATSSQAQQQQQFASPFLASSSSPPRSATTFGSTPLPQQHEDKSKDVRRTRLFNRERSAPSVGASSSSSGTTNSSGLPPSAANEKSSHSGASQQAQMNKKCHYSSIARDAKLSEASPRKILLEQLSRCMPADDALPDHVIMVSGSDLQGCNLAGRLAERQQRALNTIGAADVRATIACLASKIQKFCNCSAKPPPPIKVVLVGNDAYINSVLRSYVEQFSSKPPDWKNHLKFYVVPLTPVSSSSSGGSNNNGTGSGNSGNNNTLARYLASLDRYYSVNFLSDSWREALDRPADKMLLPGLNGNGGEVVSMGTPAAQISPSKIDVQEVIHRLGRYLTSNGCTVQVPIAEAMITYREPGSEEESTQVFIPFVSEVRIGISEATAQSPASSMVTNSLDLQAGEQLDGQQLSGLQIGGSSHQPVAATVSSYSSGSPPQPSPLLLSVNASNCPPGSSVGQGSGEKGDRERDTRDRMAASRTTPPSSPNISSMHSTKELMTGSSSESVELQVDYWLSGSSAIAAAAAARENNAASSTAGGSTTIGGLAATMAQAVSKSRGSGIGGGGASATGGDGKGSFQEPSSIKYTVKAGFRWIVVQRLPSSGSVITGSTAAPGSSSSADSSSLFTMTFGLKEKKQKIMRLGKKKSEKERESEASKSQVVEGINRLVCQAKTHHSMLKVVIDGVEWNNVKFFQLSSQWQTHIRHFPVALFTESVL